MRTENFRTDFGDTVVVGWTRFKADWSVTQQMMISVADSTQISEKIFNQKSNLAHFPHGFQVSNIFHL